MGGGKIFDPFPGAGGFDWSISRIDAGGLDGSLAVVVACFPWGMFVLVRPHSEEEVQDCDQVQGGGGAGFFAAICTLSLYMPGSISISLKVRGYSPCRSWQSRAACCGSNLSLRCPCWQGHQTGEMCLPNTLLDINNVCNELLLFTVKLVN